MGYPDFRVDYVDFRMIQLVPLIFLYIIIAFLIHLKKPTSIFQHIINLSFFVYIILVLGKTLFPLPVSEYYINLNIEQDTVARHNFIPFTDIYNIINSGMSNVIITQIGGNLLLMMPLGFYAPFLSKKFKNLKSVFFLGLIASLCIEAAQLIISLIIGMTYRSFVFDDLILNILGTIIGFIIIKLISPILVKIIDNSYFKNNQSKWILNLRRLNI